MGDTMALLQPRMAFAFRALPALCHVPFTSSVAFRSLRSFRPSNLSLRASFAAHAAVLERAETAATTAGFGELGLGAELLTAVSEHRLNSPTEIQTAAIPEILRGGDVLLASHTGSGKTLAYLLPLVKMLRDQEQAEGIAARPKRPRALVLGPTRELTDQILRVAKSISHHARFRSACVNGGGTMGQQTAALAGPLDILIGTPQKVVQHAAQGHLFYGDVRFVVLDEADTMFDKGFGPEVRALLQPLRGKEHPATCILVLATLKKEVQKLLAEEFPGMRHVRTSSLHKGVSTARHAFLPIPGLDNKLDHLAQVVASDQVKGRRVMVFCNTLDSCRATEHFLRDRGLPTRCYHGDVPLDGRRDAIRDFAPADDAPGFSGQSEQPVLVCTDLAARGLDMPGRVDHVVNFDFPLNPIDYIHRAGRTARAGASGRITSLVQKRDQVLASRIEDALKHGRPLDELSAKREVLPPNMRPKEETLQRRQIERKAAANSRKGVRGAARMGLTNPKLNPKLGGGGSRPKSASSSAPAAGRGTARASSSYLDKTGKSGKYLGKFGASRTQGGAGGSSYVTSSYSGGKAGSFAGKNDQSTGQRTLRFSKGTSATSSPGGSYSRLSRFSKDAPAGSSPKGSYIRSGKPGSHSRGPKRKKGSKSFK